MGGVAGAGRGRVRGSPGWTARVARAARNAAGAGRALRRGPATGVSPGGATPGKDDGFWQAYFDLDPIGTCKRLLRDRDLLWLWGWTGQGVSRRLAELQEATAAAPAGIPDRLQAVAKAPSGQRAVFQTLASYTPVELLPPGWRAVFQALQQTGVAVEEADSPGGARPRGTSAGRGRPRFNLRETGGCACCGGMGRWIWRTRWRRRWRLVTRWTGW